MGEDFSESDKIEYAVFLISDFAERRGISPKQAFDYLDERGGISFIVRNYGIARTLGFGEMADYVATFCQRNGGGAE